jgi:phenylpropionate dioxygenase-like ring-hydroxylating dioxygenase large terminal subunit
VERTATPSAAIPAERVRQVPDRVAKDRYVSPDFLRLELEHVFPRVWQLAGPLADLDRPGAYFTFELGDEAVLVVRQPDGVRAFHNVCLHRGRTLCEPGRGHGETFRCPYHHWEYGLDGRLVRMPGGEGAARWRDGGAPRLREVACAVAAGFVWVHLGPDPEPLRDFLGVVLERLHAYRMEEYALDRDQTVELECNWKVAADAFNEAYHLHAVHPQLLAMLDETRVETELLGRHAAIRVPFGVPSPSQPDRESVSDALRDLLRQAGIDPARYTGGAAGVRPAIQQALRARPEFDFSALTDAQLTENHYFYVFPNVALNLYALTLMVLRYRPHPSDPHRMLFDQQEYVRVPAGGKRPARPKHERFRYGEGSLGPVGDQDTYNLIRVQRGMRSSGFEMLRLGDRERCIQQMHATLDRYIGGAPLP